MLTSSRFLRTEDAESNHLVTVSVLLPPSSQSVLERRLGDAFTSDGFDESAKAWNEERSLIVQEVLTQHLLPIQNGYGSICGMGLRTVLLTRVLTLLGGVSTWLSIGLQKGLWRASPLNELTTWNSGIMIPPSQPRTTISHSPATVPGASPHRHPMHSECCESGILTVRMPPTRS
ncbi:hypothetical protein BDZ89DRAFT_1067893 [Hymenopellis radicata]|nr:hypothetical protein BDZ89DRAFT_1067893 [Hymenopellis radicata]